MSFKQHFVNNSLSLIEDLLTHTNHQLTNEPAIIHGKKLKEIQNLNKDYLNVKNLKIGETHYLLPGYEIGNRRFTRVTDNRVIVEKFDYFGSESDEPTWYRVHTLDWE